MCDTEIQSEQMLLKIMAPKTYLYALSPHVVDSLKKKKTTMLGE